MAVPRESRSRLFGGIMAKTRIKKPAAAKKSTLRVDSKAKSAEEIQRVRNKVANLIYGNSEEMAARVVQSVTEGGQVAALKYLWEMAGLFPFEGAGDNGERESLTKILLQRMGLPGKTVAHAEDDEGDVESEDELQESD